MTASANLIPDTDKRTVGPSTVSIKSVNVQFAGQAGEAQRPVLSDFSLDAADGEFIALIGPSGCGKTTILNFVAGLVKPTSGSVALFGTPPRTGRSDVGYMFARDALMPWRTARHNVELGLELRKFPKHERRARAIALLEQVHLGPAADKYPAELSQGMRQRVALARTWAANPRLLLMDEPFAALDAQTRASVRDGFLEIWDEAQRKTVLFVTHDISEALLLADRVVTIGHGALLTDVRVPFERPRSQAELLKLPEYQDLYDKLHRDLAVTRLCRAGAAPGRMLGTGRAAGSTEGTHYGAAAGLPRESRHHHRKRLRPRRNLRPRIRQQRRARHSQRRATRDSRCHYPRRPIGRNHRRPWWKCHSQPA
jgi:NitT/TauT family transport system ATP-binding protein